MIDPKSIDYRQIVSELIWHNYIYTKNDYSGYFEVIGEPTEHNRGDIFKKGMIMGNPKILSFSIPETRELRWSELAIKLGIDVERYVEDGHDCHKCPMEKTCDAHFKYESPIFQPQCGGWREEVDDTVYKVNMEKAKNI